jgi:enoyl-CoA hydratase/carnithine racemase
MRRIRRKLISSDKQAFEMGLANRVVAVGSVMGIATSLAQSIAKFPPLCVAADRSSTYYSVFSATSLDDALKYEYEHGKAVIVQEGVAGAKKFAMGMGRHGKFNLKAWDQSVRNRQPESTLLSEDPDDQSHHQK